jgi:hypothetical protein
MNPVKAALDVLCQQYARNGEPHRLNDVQAVIYLDELSRFQATDIERAARQWMRQSRFFPAVSDLLDILEPKPDWPALSNLAWAHVCQAIRQAGAYRGATFVDASIGQAVKQTFGTWPAACAFDSDSPGFAIRRQTFLAIFPKCHEDWQDDPPMTLRGEHRDAVPMLIPALGGLPEWREHTTALPEPPDRSQDVLGDVTRRFNLTKRDA